MASLSQAFPRALCKSTKGLGADKVFLAQPWDSREVFVCTSLRRLVERLNQGRAKDGPSWIHAQHAMRCVVGQSAHSKLIAWRCTDPATFTRLVGAHPEWRLIEVM